MRFSLSKKRHGFGGISNLILYPILVMIFASILATTTSNPQTTGNSVNYINGNPLVANNNTIVVCLPSQNQGSQCLSPNGTLQNTTGKTVTTLQCTLFDIVCKVICFISGQNSTTCHNQQLASEIKAGLAPTSPNLGFILPSSTLGLIQGAFNPANGGFIAFLIVAVGAVLLIGVTIFGNGINPASIYLAFLILTYVGVWTVLSVTSAPIFGVFNSISNPVGMPTITDSQGLTISTGAVLYYILSIFYALGVMQRLG